MFCLHMNDKVPCAYLVHRDQKRALNPLELDLQTAVNHMWMVGIKPASSRTNFLNHCAISGG